MKVLKDFFKQKETMLGISAAIAFQLIFVIVWLTGYDGVYDRTDQFSIGIVNEDSDFGEEIVNELNDEGQFKISQFDELNDAKNELDQRSINMLIHFPDGIVERITKDDTVSIDYYINQSAPTLTKQMMETGAHQLNGEFNKQMRNIVDEQISETIPGTIAAEMSDETTQEMAQEIATQVIDLVQENTDAMPIDDNIIKTNEKDGFAITMVPLLIVLASYISAMLISQYLQFANRNLSTDHSRTSLFIGRQTINVLLAIGIALLTICLMYLFNIELAHNFFVLWGFQAILLFSFLAISQVFVMLFGNPGMLFNIALTATQLVSSGAIVPRELLPSFYYELGNLLPATYGVNSYFSLIYGGGDLSSELKHLVIITSALLMAAIIIQLMFYIWGKTRPVKR